MAKTRLAEVGWVWEGLGFDEGVEPSIYGVGEGARYFGLQRSILIFHPNNEITLGKLADKREVVADISKWKWVEESKPGKGTAFRNQPDARPETIRAEAEKLSRLSLRFPNVSGAFFDDALGLLKKQGAGGEQMARVHEALTGANGRLRLWVVVYTHELEDRLWGELMPYIDVVNLWVWEARNLGQLEGYTLRCREVFEGKPINIGVYMRDYPTRGPVPLRLLEEQFNTIVKLLAEGTIEGYSILGGCLIDQHPEQAEWIRDFIAQH